MPAFLRPQSWVPPISRAHSVAWDRGQAAPVPGDGVAGARWHPCRRMRPPFRRPGDEGSQTPHHRLPADSQGQQSHTSRRRQPRCPVEAEAADPRASLRARCALEGCRRTPLDSSAGCRKRRMPALPFPFPHAVTHSSPAPLLLGLASARRLHAPRPARRRVPGPAGRRSADAQMCLQRSWDPIFLVSSRPVRTLSGTWDAADCVLRSSRGGQDLGDVGWEPRRPSTRMSPGGAVRGPWPSRPCRTGCSVR